MIPLIASLFALVGAVFVLLAAVGTWRFPDAYCRMHAAAKAGSFGSIWLGAAIILSMPNLNTVVRIVLIVVAIYFTAPVACHLIARLARQQDKE